MYYLDDWQHLIQFDFISLDHFQLSQSSFRQHLSERPLRVISRHFTPMMANGSVRPQAALARTNIGQVSAASRHVPKAPYAQGASL